MKYIRGCAAMLAAMTLFAGVSACAQETAPLAPAWQVREENSLQRAEKFGARRSYNGVEASDDWLYQARLGNRLLNLRMFTAEGRQITFQEDLGAADDMGNIRLTLRGGSREEKLLLQLDQDAADTLARLKITKIVVTDTDLNVQAEYLTEDLLALRSTFGLGETEMICVSGETEPVTVVSVDGVRRQITD